MADSAEIAPTPQMLKYVANFAGALSLSSVLCSGLAVSAHQNVSDMTNRGTTETIEYSTPITPQLAPAALDAIVKALDSTLRAMAQLEVRMNDESKKIAALQARIDELQPGSQIEVELPIRVASATANDALPSNAEETSFAEAFIDFSSQNNSIRDEMRQLRLQNSLTVETFEGLQRQASELKRLLQQASEGADNIETVVSKEDVE